jgi:aryl-alcohol dehydrogenase-like predicted oxidoreductase
MKTIHLPRTDIIVSQLALGCWGLSTDFHWGTRDRDQSVATIHAALDAGINFFDTAEMYANGDSESLLGAELAGKRQQVVIATKMRPDSMQPADIPVACERSLRRLATDYIDLYQIHWPSRDVPLADTWSAMLKLKQQGKVRAIGVCNFGPGDLADVIRLEKPVTNQLPYNLLWRAIEHKILPLCQQQDIATLIYSPLMHGLLAGKYETADDVPDGIARSRHFNASRPLARHGEPGCERETFAAIRAIREIAQSLDRTMADVALSWLAAQSSVTAIIAGARTPQQLTENVAQFENLLPDDIVQQLRAATDALNDALGSNVDMWQGAANSRYR